MKMSILINPNDNIAQGPFLAVFMVLSQSQRSNSLWFKHFVPSYAYSCSGETLKSIAALAKKKIFQSPAIFSDSRRQLRQLVVTELRYAFDRSIVFTIECKNTLVPCETRFWQVNVKLTTFCFVEISIYYIIYVNDLF